MNFIRLVAGSTDANMGVLYRSAATAMDAYCKWITMQSSVGERSCDEMLARAKQHALTWFDGVSPEYLALPGAIVDADIVVGPTLGALAQLARQPSSGAGTNPLGEAISKCADDLRRALGGLSERAGALAAAMRNSVQMLETDGQDFLHRSQEEERRLRELSMRMSRLQGEAHAAESARCLDRNRIRALNMDIDQVRRDVQNASRRTDLTGEAAQRSHDALGGTNYLARFWDAAAGDARASIATLVRLQREPARLADVDMANAHAHWTRMVRDFEQVARAVG